MSAVAKASRPYDSASFEELRRKAEHIRRCRALPPLQPGEAEQLVAAFAAKRGGFTKCPTAYLLPTQQ